MFSHLHLHTCYSHDCTSKIKKIVDHIKKLGQTACAITDHGNMSGCVEFYQTCNNNNILPILGMEAYITKNGKSAKIKDSSNKELNHLVLLAQNYTGYKNLLKLVYLSNLEEHYYYRPRIDEEMLFNNSDGIICINGHHSTSLFDILFFNQNGVNNAQSYEEARNYLSPTCEQDFVRIADKYRNVFGNNFYVECQLFDRGDMLQQCAAKTLFNLSQKYNFKAVGTGDAHYIDPKDAYTHKVFVAIKQNCKVKDLPNIRYFTENEYYIFGQEHAEQCYPQELLNNIDEIVSKIEKYDITRPASIPSFCANADDVLYEQAGQNIGHIVPNNEVYLSRFKKEFDVIKMAGLSNYFLIVADYIQWAIGNGILVGPGRGSSASCLISYLLGITKIDPIKYGLIFERFYNEIRAEAKALPDIDTDFPATKRDYVVEYIKQKYGHNNVCGVITFNTLQGKGALKDTLRTFGVCDFKQMNAISDLIPSRDKISDKLAEFKEATGSDSIIYYTLKMEPDLLKDYVQLDENGELVGVYADYFKIAIELEGSIKSESKHASAYIISDRPIYEIAPVVKDKTSNNLLCALDMQSFENVGLVKFDLLSLKNLDGLMEVNKLLKEVKYDFV